MKPNRRRMTFGTACLTALAVLWCAGCEGAMAGDPSCAGDEFICGSECVHLARDPGNCGACGVTCGFGELCRDGTCQRDCAAGLVACGGECRDLRSDGENCGACGVDCGPDAYCAGATCVEGPAPGSGGTDWYGHGGGGRDHPPPHGNPPLP